MQDLRIALFHPEAIKEAFFKAANSLRSLPPQFSLPPTTTVSISRRRLMENFPIHLSEEPPFQILRDLVVPRKEVVCRKLFSEMRSPPVVTDAINAEESSDRSLGRRVEGLGYCLISGTNSQY
ncbi:hypothetical protein HHK36_033092 [Tetracentron sinense]|uniref:Uncharacterized protein n=1 Tax=Tetracentron sinense TaxID=13715 RepID=A0A835CWF8_TETSI|nr:hypothetical protein HHK36_033092 [Tetracentron sinense]